MTTEQVTVAEIAAGSLAAVRVFERLGIDYCCGGRRPLDEVCREKGLESGAVRSELDAAMSDGGAEARDWQAAPLSELIAHIVGTHHSYLRRELPVLSARVEKVHRVYTGRGQSNGLVGLPETFEALRAELESHMNKEEQILFPVIEAYERLAGAGADLPPVPFGSVANPIRMMEMEHDQAGGALERIREITSEYAVPEYACITYRAMLAGLKELEQDLHMHIHLENNVLFPRALKLERAQ
jgi:regulator of cell morphogenesis and NO signaling